jgi:hypothetical protein
VTPIINAFLIGMSINNAFLSLHFRVPSRWHTLERALNDHDQVTRTQKHMNGCQGR